MLRIPRLVTADRISLEGSFGAFPLIPSQLLFPCHALGWCWRVVVEGRAEAMGTGAKRTLSQRGVEDAAPYGGSAGGGMRSPLPTEGEWCGHRGACRRSLSLPFGDSSCCGAQNSLLAERSQNFDRCHSLTSLPLPPAALDSLPLYTREPCPAGAGDGVAGDMGDGFGEMGAKRPAPVARAF